jgi:hypothetical protein
MGDEKKRKKRPARKSEKPGPNPESLVISEDPQTALQRLLRARRKKKEGSDSTS